MSDRLPTNSRLKFTLIVPEHKLDPRLILKMTSVINLVQQNDQEQIHKYKLKADRFYFTQNQGWYFYCRDGNRGPFETRTVAELALTQHIKEQSNLAL